MRIYATAALLALGTGCMSLDFMMFDAPRVDVYRIDNHLVDDELIDMVTFESTDGTLLYGAWAHQPLSDRLPLIYFHGQSGTLESEWERVEYYWTWGYEVFVFDYRGFGRSEGEAHARGVLEEDGLAAVEFVVNWTGQAPETIPWAALSLGGSIATHTADEIDAQAIILESMFASADAILDESAALDLPVGWFFEGEFDNVAAVEHVNAPVFVIHGLDDDYINPAFALDIYDAAPNPKQLWQPEGVKHADLPEIFPEEFQQRALDFYAEHMP